MSTNRSPESDPNRDSPTDEYTSDRDRNYPEDVARLNGYELVAINEWLPGMEPTPYELNLTDGYEYRTRYWRCRRCGQEHNHRDEFTTPFEQPPATDRTRGRCLFSRRPTNSPCTERRARYPLWGSGSDLRGSVLVISRLILLEGHLSSFLLNTTTEALNRFWFQ